MRSLAVLALLALGLAACEAVDKGLETLGVKNEVESEAGIDVDPLLDAGKKLARSFEEITPEQEYYIGRAVAAEVLARTPVLEDDAATVYLNHVGQTLAQASDRPDVFGGYHFFILDSDDVNALAAPGAFIFVTRGLLRACQSEDELAAVLAHEVTHIVGRDGMRMIQKSERFQALAELGVAQALESGDVRILRQALDRIASELATTLLQHGYSRSLETNADEEALVLTDAVGYRAQAMRDLMERLNAQEEGDGGAARPLGGGTHPERSARIRALDAELKGFEDRNDSAARLARFNAALAPARG